MAVFPPNVERWRSLVAKYFPAHEVDRALWVIQHESGGDPGIASRFNAGGGENSHGLWQINLKAHPGMQGKTNDPEAATAYAAQLFKTSGWQPWSVTHKGFPSDLGASASALQVGSGSISPPSVGSAGMVPKTPVDPQDPDYINSLPFTPADFQETDDFGNVRTNWAAYMQAAMAYGEMSGMNGQDNADYIEGMISEYSMAIAGGNLKLDQAVAEFNKRLGALQEGNNMFAKMVGYAIPKGGDYPQADFYKNLANGGPGGLTGGPPTTQTINPFAQAAATMEGIPNFMDFGVPEVPDISGLMQEHAASTASKGNPFLSALTESINKGKATEAEQRMQMLQEAQRMGEEARAKVFDMVKTTFASSPGGSASSQPNLPQGSVAQDAYNAFDTGADVVGDAGEFWWNQLTKYRKAPSSINKFFRIGLGR